MRIRSLVILGMLSCVVQAGCRGTVDNCTAQYDQECHEGQVYWLDSCGQRGEIAQTCPCGCADQNNCIVNCSDPCSEMVCDQPPADECLDEATQRTYEPLGTCSDGQCTYQSRDIPCPDRCQEGRCQGDPCAQIICDQAPPPLCVDQGSIRTYENQGTCDQGICSYDYEDQACLDCCYGAEINPTGDPIGGGPGYRDIQNPDQAHYLVSDATGLLAALDGASSGELIYIADQALIDLTGYDDIQVPAGVTVASGRGRGESQGALIWTSQFDTFPLFMAAGADVRFTGLRIMGPDPEVGDHDYQNPELSRGIQTGSPDLEVDNCELSGFGHAAVVVYGEQASSHVHHNYIHHNTRAGLGYGVVLSESYCLIEANLFDANRHSIAGTGRPGSSYEARYNLVLPHATGHYFDMHGAADFDKRISSAIWRFDEGSGSEARDSSVYNSNHCTLEAMDSGSVWVPGQIRTGLLFDGLDDHLSCGNHSSLQSTSGSIEFWLRPDSLNRDQELLELFEDSNQNYLAVSLRANNRIGIHIEDNGSTLLDMESDSTLNQGVLSHVVINQDGSGISMYLNGQQVAVSGSDGGAWSDHLSLTDLWLGAGQRSSFEGLLDEVRIYSRALEWEEVTRHFLGQADIAGDLIEIHHNTFRGADMSAIVIRGVPAQPSTIHHNWYKDLDPAHAVRQSNSVGNLEQSHNHYGPQVPQGTRLPTALGSAAPDSGQAPLELTFDGSTSFAQTDGPQIVNWRWDFGDGQSAWGPQVSHTYSSGGRYGVMLSVSDARGATDHTLIPIELSPGPGYWLDFWVKDSCRSNQEGYYDIQALVDGVVVWQEDVAQDSWGWRHISVDLSEQLSGQETAEITFRALNRTAVLNGELIELSVYFDDVFLFGAEQAGGDFEGASTWSYQESVSSWSGSQHAEDSMSGWRSFRIHHPYSRDCPQGAEASISQRVRLLSQDRLAEWRLDEAAGEWAQDASLYGHHGSLQNMNDQNWLAGPVGSALSFDGQNDRVEIDFTPELGWDRGTIDFWVRAPSGSGGTILSLVEDGSNYFALEIDSAGLVRVVRMTGAAPSLDLSSLVPVTDDTWHHVAIVQDSTSATIYLDGQAGSDGQNGPAWTSDLALSAVRLGDGPAGALNGMLDEVRLDRRPADGAWVLERYERVQPLGIWHFDEGSGTTTADEIAGHTGTLQSMDPGLSWITGVSGQGLWFDGQDDYLDLDNPADLSLSQGTIAFWFRPDRLNENQDLLNLFEDGYQNYLLLRMSDSNRLLVRIEDDDQGLINITSSDSVADSAFHHLAVTQDGFGVRIYLDGIEQSSSGDNGPTWTDHLALTGFWLGKGHWSLFNGAVDELLMYSRALRESEIAQLAGL